MTNLNL